MVLEASPEVTGLTFDAFDKLKHPYFGFQAGFPHFDALFARDLEESISLVASNPLNLTPTFKRGNAFTLADFWLYAEIGLDKLAQLQGKEPLANSPNIVREAKGKILHEYRDSRYSPGSRLEELRQDGWPVEIHLPTDSSSYVSLCAYFADDTTPRFPTAVYNLSLAKPAGNLRKDYLKKMLPNLLEAVLYQNNIADIDQDGLVESVSTGNPNDNCQTERDSYNAYFLENDSAPQGIRRYLSLNSHNLGMHLTMQKIGQELDMPAIINDSQLRFKEGLQRFQQVFWDQKQKFFIPLVYGNYQAVDFINDEALDPLFYRLATEEQAQAVARRVEENDFDTPWGQRTLPISSKRWFENYEKSYWNGIWPHRVAKAAIAFELNGLFQESDRKDQQLRKVAKQMGPIETFSVSKDLKYTDYTERFSSRKAGNPQLWAAAALAARFPIYIP